MTQEEFFKRYTYDVDVDRIGGGGFGTVYKAYDNVLHHDVAIKVSEVKKAPNGKTFSLRDEIEALSGLPEHPNIANYEKEKLFTFKTPQGNFDYAVMQFYPDGNLTQAIKEGLTNEQKEEIATQLLEGITFLHRHKVVHRDLKPGNILVAKHGGKVIPLITDFGLSKAADAGDGSMFSNSFGGGTPRYSSPEQLQGKPLRFNTDLWSYGAIVYELFTGEQLFGPGSGASNSAQADLEIYNKIVRGDVDKLSKMPERWRKVAERCMVVDPEQRVKSAEELLSLLKGYEGTTPVVEVSEPKATPRQPQTRTIVEEATQLTPKPTPKPMPSGGKSRKGLWIGLGVALAAIVAAMFLLMRQDPDTEAFKACQTVNDYRFYIADFGHNAKHYAEAQHFVNSFVADSTAQAQELIRQRQEDDVYGKCNTIAACDKYLKEYPNGRYVNQVKAQKAKLEKELAQQNSVGTASSSSTAKSVFSISSSQRVYFASGNLQYKASAKEWRFAPNPWDCISDANKNVSPNYSGWIDLFGWGTGNDPTEQSTSESNYSSFSDWGSKMGGGWRTLTKDEWGYVLNKRNTPSGIRYAKATVNGVHGIILLPDNWSKSAYSLKSTNDDGASYSSNNINASTWNSTFAPKGAIFLPAAGIREGSSVSYVGSRGDYWTSSSSSSGSEYAISVYFGDIYINPSGSNSRFRGRSVRLVRSAE